jgi:cytochrome c oxidase subunit 2
VPVALASVLLSPPTWWLPVDASTHGPALDAHLLLNLWIAAALFVLLHTLVFTGLALRRRQASRNQAVVEYAPAVLLALLFAFLTLRAERLWAATRYTGADPAALQVEAVGMQFAWYFRYPGKDAAFGRTDAKLIAPGEGNPVGLEQGDDKAKDDFVTSELVLPANREIDLRLHAQDVIHGFAVPELRLKQNAVPGQSFHIHFIANKPGSYAILCTQLCGLGHYRMGATLRVLPAEAYQQWLRTKEAP